MIVLHTRLRFMISEGKKIEIRARIFQHSHLNWEIIKLPNRELTIKKNRIEH